jgi:hypothetical protein
MLQRILQILVLFFVACELALLQGCRSCDPVLPPNVSVQFQGTKAYTKVSTLNPAKILSETDAQKYFLLPMPISQDGISYLFSDGVKADTLTISYKREFRFQSTSCGYGYVITNLRVQNPVSFRKVTIVSNTFNIKVSD